MDFCSPGISFKEDNEDISILDCTSQLETDQEEIADISSPECTGKNYSTSDINIYSSKKKKFSVKRTLLFQKPILDNHLTNSKSLVRSGDSIVREEFYGLKDEIVCSQDSSANISSENEEQHSIKLFCETSYPTDTIRKGHGCNLDDSDIEEEIICSQDSVSDILIKQNQYIIESTKFKETLAPNILFQDKGPSSRPFSDVSWSRQIFFSSNKHKDNSDFDKIKEEIIYSQDSDVKLSESGCNLFSNTYEKINISSSPSKFSIEEEKQEEDIDFNGSDIEGSFEQNSHVNLTPSTNLLQKTTTLAETAAARCLTKKKYVHNDSIDSPTSNHLISETEVHEPNSEFLVKAPKKGTLLQRAYHIISDSKKEANLLSYEIQVGLRESKGVYVSQPLIIQNIYFEENNYIISCKPYNIEDINYQGRVNKRSIFMIISNLTMDMRINSVIVIHFPLVALLVLPLMKVILFAENRVQVISSSLVTGSIDICLPNLIIGPRDQKIIRSIKKTTSKTVIDSIFDQLFGKFCSLELKLLHIFKQRTASNTAVEILAVDSENQFCLVKDSEYILLKNINLEVNSSYIFHGFTLICSSVKTEIKSAAEYYSSLTFTNNFIYIVEPCVVSWKINHLFKTAANTRYYTSLSSAIKTSKNHQRFELLLKEYRVVEDIILIRDESISEMLELQFDEQSCTIKMKLISLSMPVVLSGIYFLNGCIYYDKYSQLIVL